MRTTTNNDDFSLANQSVTITPKNQAVTTSVATKSDGLAESNEVLILTLASTDQSRVRIGARKQVDIQIDDTKDRGKRREIVIQSMLSERMLP